MRQLLTAAFGALVCIVVQPAMAQEQGSAVPIAVPIERAPYHLPVFTNEYVTVLNVYVPPQRNTGYHTHSRDSVSVNIEDADMTNQDLGAPQPGPPQRAARGRASRVQAITQQAPGIRIVVSGGELVESVPGQPERGMSLKLGEFYWQDRGVTRTVRNSGTTRVEVVEFELK